MAFDMIEETQRHRAGWNGFCVFMSLGSLGVILVLAIMALTLL